MRAVQLGNKEMALSSRSLWLCVSCSTCTSRCPNNIDVAKVMDVLRHMAWKEGKTNYAMASFWQSFLTTVRHFGRTYELGVMAMFMARTGRVFTDVDLAPRILPKQKLPFKPHTIVGKDAKSRLIEHFLNSDAFINTTVRDLQACFVLPDDRFAAQPTRKVQSIRQLMAKAG